MSAIPANLSRAPNYLLAQSALGSITRSNLSLFNVQNQISSGRAVNRFSDDAVKAAAISILDDRLGRSAQRARNLDHADASLSLLDSTLGDASDLVLEAKTIASAQAGSTASPEERRSQAPVVDSLLQGLFGLSNRKSQAGYMFAGSTPSSPAVEAFHGGYRYRGQGSGLLTDIDLGSSIPITLGGGNAIGSTSARLRGTADLDPELTADTRIADLKGARGLGVTLGIVQFSFDGGPATQIDLTGADTAQDVVTRLTNALHDYETANSVTILGPGGITLSGGSISIDVAPAGSPPNPQLVFSDLTAGITAADLGLSAAPFEAGAALTPDLDPSLTWRTPISALAGAGGALGQIKVSTLGQTRTIDLSAAATLEDVRNALQGADLGLRVQINADGTGLDVLNEVASGRDQALSIEEVTGNNLTATRLGIRTFAPDTLVADLNFGNGVQIADGGVDPETGLPDPARDVDFRITLGNGDIFTVDLRPDDLTTVQSIIDRINQQAAAGGIAVPADFSAGLSDGDNGLTFTQNAGFAGAISVTGENNSPAAEQLGLLEGAYASGTFRATDRAKVRVDNLFAHLIDLRDSLLNNDTVGITVAGEGLEADVSSLAETRALVGSYARRVSDGISSREDRDLIDTKTKSDLQDTDFTAAAIQLSLLETQLQASLQVTASSLSRSLLDFLG
jgi:flagellar hook-associated protein 3 FlgL